MTFVPPSGVPFPYLGGRPVDPSADPTDPWYRSLHDRLFDRRVLMVAGRLDEAAATQTATELMTLDAQGDEPVELRVDCTGGTVGGALALIDVLDATGVEVHALCTGQVVGTPVGVVAVADRRTALPHARFRLCEPKVEITGRPNEIEAAIHRHRAELAAFRRRLSEATGVEEHKIEEDMRRSLYMDATEAKAYGLLDEIAPGEARVIDFPRRFGFGRH